MILNPYREVLPIFPGTRIVAADFGLIGRDVIDPINNERVWTVTGIYAPVMERCLGGIRVKLVDTKGFITFCNQRDFEVVLGVAKPGDPCIWTGKKYPHPHDEDEWFGFCMDPVDLQDDLYERELALRAEHVRVLPDGLEIFRRLHVSPLRDCEEFFTLVRDYDIETGMGPDMRIETISDRWARVSRDWIDWAWIPQQ